MAIDFFDNDMVRLVLTIVFIVSLGPQTFAIKPSEGLLDPFKFT